MFHRFVRLLGGRSRVWVPAGALSLLACAKADDGATPDVFDAGWDAPGPVAGVAGSRPLAELPASISAGRPSRVPISVRAYPGRDATRLVVDSDWAVPFELEQSAAGEAVLSVSGVAYTGDGVLELGGLTARARVHSQADTTQLRVRLPDDVEIRAFSATEPPRIVLDLVRSRKTNKPVPLGERHVRRVVLDPGHGGHDPGATGSTGLTEKQVVLDVAHRAASLLARELGVATLLTRDTDEFVSLEERTAKANAFGADLFVSIHCNAGHAPGSRGVVTFVLDAASSASHAHVAARENEGTAAGSNSMAVVAGSQSDPGTVRRSDSFAALLQRAVRASLSQGYRDVPVLGVEKAGFFVLAGARMPSVLFETSFISNPREERYLTSDRYRQKLADAIVNAVRAYRDGH